MIDKIFNNVFFYVNKEKMNYHGLFGMNGDWQRFFLQIENTPEVPVPFLKRQSGHFAMAAPGTRDRVHQVAQNPGSYLTVGAQTLYNSPRHGLLNVGSYWTNEWRSTTLGEFLNTFSE
jgi:hypothetical protein